jgi:hypothetical protein
MSTSEEGIVKKVKAADGGENRKEKIFIKVGEDRLRLSDIRSYGIKDGVRYLVKNANMVQTDKMSFESLSYYDPESQDNPMCDIYERPITIDGRLVRMGSLSEDDFVIERSRILYIDHREYHEKAVSFNIDEVLKELDTYLL